MLRDKIKDALSDAIKARDKERTSALRFIQASVKNRDIEVRTMAKKPDDDQLITGVLEKLAKQRRESIEMFESGGRADAAEKERHELAVIRQFLPERMDDAAMQAAVRAIVDRLGATTPKEMGKVMTAVREELGGKVDMKDASALVKTMLG